VELSGWQQSPVAYWRQWSPGLIAADKAGYSSELFFIGLAASMATGFRAPFLYK
jgi:hypothetical protein